MNTQRARDIVEAVYQANAMSIALEQTRLALGARSEMVRVIAGDKIISRLVPPEKSGPLVAIDNRTQIVSHMGIPEVAVVNGKTIELPPPVTPTRSEQQDVSAIAAAGVGDSEPEVSPPPPKRSPGRPRLPDDVAKETPAQRKKKAEHYASHGKVERFLLREMKKAVDAADAVPPMRLLTSPNEPQPHEVPEKPDKPQ